MDCRCRALVGRCHACGRVGHLANEPYCPQHEDHELFAILKRVEAAASSVAVNFKNGCEKRKAMTAR